MFSDPEKNIEELGLMPGMHVADIGAGSGFYSLSAAKAVGNNGKVYAIDVQKDLLSRIKNEAQRQHIKNLEVIWGNAEEQGGTKLRESSVDAAIVANLLFQIKNKEGLVKEIKRILKPKGRVLLVDWQDSFAGMGPQSGDVVLPDSSKELFEKGGLIFERRMGAGAQHYGFIFSKP
ncbi:MAG: methyltransferase domain-containing protein [Patescibacteria group bacterium]|nr:methyltransferase domain-containing protein [bacterium]MDZ4240527.1 methyltransferase domain-containing protein [Patescibacteria group bacterium]